MKGKLKLSGDWKTLLLAHSEKLGAVVVFVLVVLFIWKAVVLKGLPVRREPADIKDLTELARNNIITTPWEEFRDRPTLPNYSYRSHMPPLELEPYKIGDWDPYTWQLEDKRLDPEIYPIEDLQIHGGAGPYAVIDPFIIRRRLAVAAGKEAGAATVSEQAGKPLGELPAEINGQAGISIRKRRLPGLGSFDADEKEIIEGRRWTVVTGLVPVGKQQAEYDRVFKDAMGYQASDDRPLYLAYYVERAEVADENQTDLNWQQLELATSRTVQTKTLNFDVKKILPLEDPRYDHPVLTEPLGPRTLVDWGEEAKHPKVPWAPSRAPAEAQEATTKVDESPNAAPQDPFAEQLLRNRGPGLPGQGPGFRGSDADGKNQEKKTPVQYVLFRYFDYSVEPGKKYRYRFRLVMRDPNYRREPTPEDRDMGVTPRVPIKFLDPSVIARINKQQQDAPKTLGYRFTEWTKPTDVVRIPLDAYVLAREVKPASDVRFYDEPTARVAARVYDNKLGVEAIASKEIMRGSLLNFTDDVLAIDPVAKQFMVFHEFKFHSNTSLLDTRGGTKLVHPDKEIHDLVQPAEMLFLDQAGRLIVRNEVEDAYELNAYDALLKQQAFLDKNLGNADAPSTPLLPAAGGGLLEESR